MPPRIRLPTTVAAPSRRAALTSPAARRTLSTTPARRARESGDAEDDNVKFDKNKQAVENFKSWLRGPGENFKKPLYYEMNYISSYDRKTWQRVGTDKDRMNIPFPLNPAFRSHPVLSEELKEEIYLRIMGSGRSVRSVSAELGVGLERVAAVTRLKAVEKQWIAEGKPIATYLTKALHMMLPVTKLVAEGEIQPFHENLQDIPSHPLSHRQAFVPVSESRVFTRADAGKEFGLPPAEEVVPHPDLIELHREKSYGLDLNERIDKQRERDRRAAARREERERKAKAKRRERGQLIEKGRWVWRLKEATTGAVGHRYGVPHEDRKKGQIKIPTKVL